MIESRAVAAASVPATGSRPTQPGFGPRPARPASPALSSARAAVLRAVAATDGAVTVAALAEQLGQHPNTIREHLDALVDHQHLERTRSRPAGRGRPAWLYRTPSRRGMSSADLMADGLGDGGQEYLALAVALIDQVATTSPDPESLARLAGERWGRTLAEGLLDRATNTDLADRPATAQGSAAEVSAPDEPAGNVDTSPSGTVVTMLQALRFGPQRTDDPKRIRLTTCPLLDAARRHPDVVCQVHAGIVRGALDRLGGDPDGSGLVAFAELGACVLTLPDAP